MTEVAINKIKAFFLLTLLAFSLLLLTACAGQKDVMKTGTRSHAWNSSSLVGTWKNNENSIFQILSVNSSTGVLTGAYTNYAAGYSCQGVAYLATGYTAGSYITFTVDWLQSATCTESSTVWNGSYTKTAMTAAWTLYDANGGIIKSGTDVFAKQ